jgi:integrase
MTTDEKNGRKNSPSSTRTGTRTEELLAPDKKRSKKRSKKRTRTLSAHPGVVLLKPDDRHGWRARFDDPNTLRETKVTLLPIDARTAETRKAWAVTKSEQLQRKASDRDLGITPIEDTVISTAKDDWLASTVRHPQTQRAYAAGVNQFVSYLSKTIRLTREITVGHLTRYRSWCELSTRRLPVKGGKRGARAARSKDDIRSKESVNLDLKVAGMFLRWARKAAGVLLSRDDITDGLPLFKIKRKRKSFLDIEAISVLLTLAREHEPLFYSAIVAMLLTGLRRKELVLFEWSDVDDGDRIRLRAEHAKGGIEREVELSVAKNALPRRPANANGRVFPFSRDQIRDALERLRDRDPRLAKLTSHHLRRTCATFFTCTITPWRAAASLGHDVTILKKHYAGLVRIEPEIRTLEAAMEIESFFVAPRPMGLLIPMRKPRSRRAG